MMKKWSVIAPLGAVALAAAAAGVAALLPREKKGAAPAAAAPAAKKAPPKERKTGVYSFISGYQDAATVELSLDYDPERYDFAVVEEEFLSYSSDSHVAELFGEDFNLQIEYAAYYAGEDFPALQAHLAEKFKGFGPAVYGANAGVRFIDGDNICLAFPIPDDAHSYVLVTAMKNPDYDEDFTTLPEHPDIQELLGSLRFARKA